MIGIVTVKIKQIPGIIIKCIKFLAGINTFQHFATLIDSRKKVLSACKNITAVIKRSSVAISQRSYMPVLSLYRHTYRNRLLKDCIKIMSLLTGKRFRFFIVCKC